MIQVYLGDSFYRNALDIYIVHKHEDQPRRILRIGEDRWSQTWLDLPEGAALSNEEDRPTISLPEEVGRALLEALTRHYNGAEDTRALRRDYDAERKRVDHHVEVIADIARSLAIAVRPAH